MPDPCGSRHRTVEKPQPTVEKPRRVGLDQTWYVYKDDAKLDATVPANTADNVHPADLLDFIFNIGRNGRLPESVP
jgi:hypothetical protein